MEQTVGENGKSKEVEAEKVSEASETQGVQVSPDEGQKLLEIHQQVENLVNAIGKHCEQEQFLLQSLQRGRALLLAEARKVAANYEIKLDEKWNYDVFTRTFTRLK